MCIGIFNFVLVLLGYFSINLHLYYFNYDNMCRESYCELRIVKITPCCVQLNPIVTEELLNSPMQRTHFCYTSLHVNISKQHSTCAANHLFYIEGCKHCDHKEAASQGCGK